MTDITGQDRERLISDRKDREEIEERERHHHEAQGKVIYSVLFTYRMKTNTSVSILSTQLRVTLLW